VSVEQSHIIPPIAGLAPIDKDQQPNIERQEQEREQKADCPELIEYIKRTTDAIKKKRDAEWQQILNQQATCVAFFDNRQYGTAKDGVFVDAKREPGDVRPTDNWYKINIEKLLTEFSHAIPDIQVRAANPGDSKKVEAAKFAQSRINANRKRQLKAGFRQDEAQALLLKTITWRYVYYNEAAEDAPLERRTRKVKRQYGQTRSIRACKLCGSPMKAVAQPEGAEAAEQYQCIRCGSTREKILEVGSREAEVVDGYDEVQGGHICTRHVDPTMVRISLSARSVAQSSFLWYHQSIERHILENAYRDLKIKAGSRSDMSNADRYRLDAEGSASNAIGSFAQDAGGSEFEGQGGDQFEECPYDLFWIDYSVYARKTFPTPQRLRGGRVIPADTPLGEFFHNGLCVARNADQILDMYPENKNKKWLYCVYGRREHALHGSGTNALIGPQITRNDLKSYLLVNTYYNAAPRELIRDGCFTGNRLPAVNEAAIVKEVPDEKSMEGWAYQKSPGTPLPEQTMALYQSESGSMQEAAGTSSLSAEGAAPDIKALGTATGVNAMRQLAVARMGPNLLLLTEMEIEWSYLVLEHELHSFSDERFLSMAHNAITAEVTTGTVTYDLDGIKAFLECNPRQDFEIDAVPGSWMPRSDLDRQTSLANFLSLVKDLLAALPNHPLTQELLALAARSYGITEIDFAGWTATEQVAQDRIRAFAKTVAVFQKRNVRLPLATLVEQVIISTPEAMIDNEMDQHGLFLQFYENWWASDEGRTAPLLLKAVIKAQHVLHRAGVVEKGVNKTKADLAIEAPKATAAAAMAGVQGAGGEHKGPSVSMPYKEVPEDIKRQIEADAGYKPSQIAQPPAEDGEASKEATKVEGAMMLQERKAQLEQAGLVHKTQLELDKAVGLAQIEEDQAEADHGRALELEGLKQQHQTGMEGAKLAHEAVQKDKDRAVQQKSTKTK